MSEFTGNKEQNVRLFWVERSFPEGSCVGYLYTFEQLMTTLRYSEEELNRMLNNLGGVLSGVYWGNNKYRATELHNLREVYDKLTWSDFVPDQALTKPVKVRFEYPEYVASEHRVSSWIPHFIGATDFCMMKTHDENPTVYEYCKKLGLDFNETRYEMPKDKIIANVVADRIREGVLNENEYARICKIVNKLGSVDPDEISIGF